MYDNRNDMCKVSILVPICNVEKFLDQCLQSLVEQTLKDVEIICINDGSTDNSSNIIRRYSDKDYRFVVIDKSNSGYGDSMNQGLAAARGEYIGIVESDDFVEKNMFEELYLLAKQYDADVVKSNYNMYWGETGTFIFYNNLKVKEAVLSNEDARNHILFNAPAIWSAIYKRSMLLENSITFLSTPGASYQDTSFNFKVAVCAKIIALTSKAYLNYRQDNVNSSVKIANKEKIMYVNREYDEIRRFIQIRGFEDYFPTYCTLRLGGYMWNYLRISNDIKEFYFDVICSEIKQHGEEWEVLSDRLGKLYSKYGGYYAIVNGHKKMLDVLLWLATIKRRVVRNK